MFIVLAAFEPGGCFYWLFVALRDAWWHLLGQKNGLLPPPLLLHPLYTNHRPHRDTLSVKILIFIIC